MEMCHRNTCIGNTYTVVNIYDKGMLGTNRTDHELLPEQGLKHEAG